MSREGLISRRGKSRHPEKHESHVPSSDYAAMMDGLERALAFSRAAFRAIVDKSADGIIVLNLKGTICFANPAAEFMLGKSIEALLGEPFGIPVVPGETTELDILRNGYPSVVAEMRVAETEWQAHPAYLATLRDVTERKRYEQKLARLSAIVESTHHAVVGMTLEGVITTWNEGAERLYGYTSKDAIGQSITMLIPPERDGEHREILEKIQQGHRGVRLDTVRQRHDGTLVEVSVTTSPIADESGVVIGASVISNDITERKQAVRDLHLAIRRRDEFLATLSHELRNPLAAILNASEVIRRTASDSQAFMNARDTIERQCRQMSRLLAELLDVSRVTEGKIELHRSCVDLAVVLDDAVDTIAPLLDDRRQWLDLSVPRCRLFVDADPVRMQQVFVNLLSNAAKFSEPGGRIAVTAEVDASEAVIHVSDQGIGLSNEALASIFEPFVQVGTTLQRADAGLGLGLALVRSLVQLHGGNVVAHSDGEGCGSEFVVRLPLSASRPQPATESTETPALPGLRILIVEDNEDVGSMLGALLQSHGHDVEVVGSGRQGLETIEFLRPEVALVDIGLPEIDGYEIARQVRADARNSHVLLVALTGYGQPEDQRRALAAGFDVHMSKPVDLDGLYEILADYQRRNENRPAAGG